MGYSRYYRNRWGMIVLAVFLILYGLQAFGLKFPSEGMILAILAIVAGILIIINR
jgi:hypothetical protein